jgi:hypothetical protein
MFRAATRGVLWTLKKQELGVDLPGSVKMHSGNEAIAW